MGFELSLKDVLDAIEKAESRVNAYWNFYMLVVIACVGWLMSKEVPFSRDQGVAVICALLGFFGASIGVIHAATRRIAALEAEATAQANDASFASDAMRSYLSRPAMRARMLLTFLLHGVVDVALIYAVIDKLPR